MTAATNTTLPKSNHVPLDLLKNDSFLDLPAEMLDLLERSSPAMIQANLRRLANGHMLFFEDHAERALLIADKIELALYVIGELLNEGDDFFAKTDFLQTYADAVKAAAETGRGVGFQNLAIQIIIECYDQLDDLRCDVFRHTAAARGQTSLVKKREQNLPPSLVRELTT